MAVDEFWRVYYNPNVWDTYTKIECAAIILHELEHLLSRHAERLSAMLGHKPPSAEKASESLKALLEKANKCMDAAIHGRKGWTRDNIPRDSIFPENYGLPLGLSWEEYFKLWPDPPEEEEEEGREKGPGPEGYPGGEGSGAGQPQSWELGPPGKTGAAPGVTPEQRELIRQGTARDIMEASASGKLRGSGHGHWISWAESQLAPAKTPWQTIAAALIRQERVRSGDEDESYTRPHPLSWSLPGRIVLPSLVSFEFDVAAVFDHSSSMADKDVLESYSEVEGLIRTCGATCHAYIATTGVSETHQNLGSLRTLVSGRHRGGTDLRPAMEKAVETGCDLLVVTTDGYTPWPSERPAVPVIILLIGNHCPASRCPSWATVLECDV